MSKRIQYRAKESSEWQTITPADVKAAPEKHNHNINDINGILPVDKGGTGQSTLEEAPFVKKENGVNTAYIDADWNNNQPMSIWTKSSNQTVTSNYGLCINTTNPFLFNADTSPQTIWTGLTTKNVDKWVKTKVDPSATYEYDTMVRALCTNDFLQLFYINSWEEIPSNIITFRTIYDISNKSWLTDPNQTGSLYFKARGDSPLYRDSTFLSNLSPHSGKINFGYYLGTAQIVTTNGTINEDMYLVCDNLNSGIHIMTATPITNGKSIKFSSIFPYSLIGLSTLK